MSFDFSPQLIKTPHLRNLYQKIGMFGMAENPGFLGGDFGSKGDQVRGFGLTHDGALIASVRLAIRSRGQLPAYRLHWTDFGGGITWTPGWRRTAPVHGISRRQSGSSPLGTAAAGCAGLPTRHGVRAALRGAKPTTSRASRSALAGGALASAHWTAAAAEPADCAGTAGWHATSAVTNAAPRKLDW